MVWGVRSLMVVSLLLSTNWDSHWESGLLGVVV